MRSADYQLRIAQENVEAWLRKAEHSIRAMRDDSKHGQEWTYIHLTNMQDDIAYLNKFIEQFMIIRLMRDADEIDHPDDRAKGDD